VTKGVPRHEIGISNAVLITAFGNRSKRLKKQCYLEFRIGGDVFEGVFLVAPQLVNLVILGCDFGFNYGVVIDFYDRSISYEKEGIRKICKFCERESDEVVSNTCELRKCSSIVRGSSLINPSGETCGVSVAEPFATVQRSCISSLVNVEAAPRIKGDRYISETDFSSQSKEMHSKCASGQRSLLLNRDSGEVKEDYGVKPVRRFDDLSFIDRKTERDEKLHNGAGERKNSFSAIPSSKFNDDIPDHRVISTTELAKVINGNDNLTTTQKESLIKLMEEYKNSLTSRPGKCNLLEYEFKLTDERPVMSHSRTVPFAVRPIIRQQVRQMIQDDVLEISHSPYINPITIVYREGKSPRLCIDARRINSVTVPDRERTPPLHELLQRFHGAKYMTSIDLAQAFLQIKLKKTSRPYTAFLFDSAVYQFKRTPYGFRNSLSAFVRGLKLALGFETAEFVVYFVDDLLIYSRSFSDHLIHIDMVLDRLTRAGFTVNAAKCRFCEKEISFLGHKIDQTGVSADPSRMDAILKYPAPRNLKQLRQFLGTCNFHNRFILNYADYVAPLLPLMKKGTRWRWTADNQVAFETLRAQFAKSIHLIHPSDDLPYEIYTDASKFGISCILTQTNEGGERHIVSTASRVLTSTEQRYSTCEQELLAVVYALQKFRIYVFGHQITVYSDNKALSFVKKCALTSNRVTRWVLQLQEYDLDIQYIKGTDNFFADVLSRNPVGLEPKDLQQLRKPRDIVVAPIKLYLDTQIKEDLKRLAEFQSRDRRVEKIKQKLVTALPALDDKYSLKDGILHFKGRTTFLYWRPYLPSELEDKVIKYVHTLSGHQGTDRCIEQINHTFYVRNLGRKVRRFISHCDICQRVKHPNRSYDVEVRAHLPSEPGELMSLDLYGPLPTGRAGVKYILVCLDVFTKHVKLYPLRAATTRACLNKLTNHYFPNVIHPKCILNDHGSQFFSPLWKETLSKLNISVKFSPIRHPQSNPSERQMQEISKFFRIYCDVAQKRWPELTPQIEEWLNTAVSGSTGYTPVELMFGKPKPDVFERILRKTPEQKPAEESLENKLLKAYAKMKLKAEERKKKRKSGSAKWDPKLNDQVLVRKQLVSDAVRGITSKFVRLYDGPYTITNVLSPSMFEVSDLKGRVRGTFNKQSLKPYLRELA
jgi:hypothetical protein